MLFEIILKGEKIEYPIWVKNDIDIKIYHAYKFAYIRYNIRKLLNLDLAHPFCEKKMKSKIYERLISGNGHLRDIYKTVLISFYDNEELEKEFKNSKEKKFKDFGDSGYDLIFKLSDIFICENEIIFDLTISNKFHQDVIFATTNDKIVFIDLKLNKDISDKCYRSYQAKYFDNYKNIYTIGLMDNSLTLISMKS